MKTVYLVSAKRTPHAKAGADLKDVPAPYLGVTPIKSILDETGIPTDEVDEVIMGNVGTPVRFPNIGRVVALEAGLDKKTSGYSVHRNCASGLEAVSQGMMKIQAGRADLIFAGGLENMSQMPLIYNKKMTNFFMKMMKAKTAGAKASTLAEFRPDYLKPIIAIEQGLTDPFCGLNMGQTAELLAREFGISREEQDKFADRSHHLAVKAQKEGKFDDEIAPLLVGSKLDRLLTTDVGPRENSSVEKLSTMRPYFERKTGTVTIGNSCPITDGGSAVLLASEEAVKKYDLEPMGRLVDFHFSGLEPERMGMGPLLSTAHLLEKTGLFVEDLDLVEINEAFAAQVLSVLKGFSDSSFALKFGLSKNPGEIPLDKLNVNGGAIALGHPVGSTGSRLIVTLAHEMEKRKVKRGLATLCIGGGQGGAVIIERD